MLQWVDGMIIDGIFQPVSDKFQRLTGKDCFFLSRVFFHLACVALLMDCGLMIFGPKSNLVDIFSSALIAAIAPLGIYFVLMQGGPRTKEGFINQERINPMFMVVRLLSSVHVVVYLAKVALGTYYANYTAFFVVYHVCVWGGFHFRACTPLPPQKSWARKAVEKLKAAFGGSAEPIPEPTKS
jgi:hypothetical protein